jgi:hypothetical protein
VRYHPRYLNAWLTQRGIRPQKPQRPSKDQDPEEVARWRRDRRESTVLSPSAQRNDGRHKTSAVKHATSNPKALHGLMWSLPKHPQEL